jgi:Holliday junction resolvasome RuvABC endonuclease subunit
MSILGIDPGFAAMGLALYEEGCGFTYVNCITTKKDHDRNAACDLFVRCAVLASELALETPDTLCVEAMSYPRNASSATKLGASHGVLAAMCSTLWEVEHVELLSPLAARKAVTGLKKPGEIDAHAAVLLQHPELLRLTEGLRKADMPHILDAAVQVAAYIKEGHSNG